MSTKAKAPNAGGRKRQSKRMVMVAGSVATAQLAVNPRPVKGWKHTYVSVERARMVWAAVTKTPNAPVRELAETLGISYSSVQAALRYLREAGYITFPPATTRTRVILVPLIEVQR